MIVVAFSTLDELIREGIARFPTRPTVYVSKPVVSRYSHGIVGDHTFRVIADIILPDPSGREVIGHWEARLGKAQTTGDDPSERFEGLVRAAERAVQHVSGILTDRGLRVALAEVAIPDGITPMRGVLPEGFEVGDLARE